MENESERGLVKRLMAIDESWVQLEQLACANPDL